MNSAVASLGLFAACQRCQEEEEEGGFNHETGF